MELLRNTRIEAIIQDFNRQTGGGREDPVIHFYEEFLTAYDKAQKVQRGVYYTPQPVVNFMVRAVDSIIKEQFGLRDGLASEETKKIKVKRKSYKKRAGQGYKEVEELVDVPAIQVLDPATGTGTFLRQTILQIYENFKAKHKGLRPDQLAAEWNKYVPEQLLPRLNGFELMMAPYAVAHMKLAMVLKDTGYDFSSDSRLKVYLTNSLEEPGSSDEQMSFFDDPLAIESIEANGVKKNSGINIVLGNPPYSVSSSNRSEWILNLLSSYKQGLNEKKLNLDDDYIKFIRYGEHIVSSAGQGILAFISNNSFLDGVTHRQMRTELLRTFDRIYIIDLHGSTKRHETAPDGSKDENVFDIQQGVSINIFVKETKSPSFAQVYHYDLFGMRDRKYSVLNSSKISHLQWTMLHPSSPYFFFAPKDFSTKDEYERGFLLTELFDVNNSGIKTDRDSLFIDMDRDLQLHKSKTLLAGNLTPDFIEKYRVEDSSSYKLTEKIKGKNFDPSHIQSIIYRPYDYQWIYYDPSIISRPGYATMKHMLFENWGMYVKRGFEDSDAPPAFCCNQLVCMRAWSRPGSIGSEYLFPLYQYSSQFGKQIKKPNFKSACVKQIEASLKLSLVCEGNTKDGFTALQLFDYIYAVLHDSKYTKKFREFLKIEFPRIPFPQNQNEFFRLSSIGAKLRLIHCMVNSELSATVNFVGSGSNLIEKITWKNECVFINKTQYFSNISSALWNYYVGGYQPLQKWLKDRKGMPLTSSDIEHYSRIVFAIEETERIIATI